MSHFILPKKRGEITLSVHDILSQNSAIQRSISPTMIQDSWSQVLTRYALLSFTYHLTELQQGEPIRHISICHHQAVFHFMGPEKSLDAIARHLFGVSLKEIKAAIEPFPEQGQAQGDPVHS